jgi:hypothetical protein
VLERNEAGGAHGRQRVGSPNAMSARHRIVLRIDAVGYPAGFGDRWRRVEMSGLPSGKSLPAFALLPLLRNLAEREGP